MGRSDFLQCVRTAGLLLALFALTFKALLPPGYMLAPAQDGALTVTLCSLSGPVEITVDPATGAPPRERPAQPDHALAAPCAFAVAAPLGVSVEAPSLASPSASVAVDVEAPPLEVAALASMAAPPPWATGPPLSI